MTLQKLRDPASVAGAVTRIAGALTVEAAAEAVGKSAGLVRRWMDPDDTPCPSHEQCLALDAAWVAAGLGEPPLLRLYQRQLEARAGRPVPTVRDCLSEVLDIPGAVGRLTEAVNRSLGADSPLPGGLTHNEALTLLDTLEVLRQEVDEFEQAVRQQTRGGPGDG